MDVKELSRVCVTGVAASNGNLHWYADSGKEAAAVLKAPMNTDSIAKTRVDPIN